MTCGGVIIGALVLLILAPIWIVVCVVIDVFSRKWRFPTLRLIAFALCWTWLESAGVIASFFLWIFGQGKNVKAHYALQRWWAAQLIRSLRLTCGLKIEVSGADEVGDGPLVCFGRHASLGDALVSAWIFGSLTRRYPRYVMKKELLADPCLDIVGQRIPNYFVDRGSAAVRQELVGIRTMAAGLGDRDVAVIFPEGTRANDKRRTALVERLEKRAPDRYALFREANFVLPPRPAGATALLEEVPNANVVLLWHVGFDGLDSFGGILRRLSIKEPAAHVTLELIPRESVPSGDAFVTWLDERWMEIDEKVKQAYLSRQGES